MLYDEGEKMKIGIMQPYFFPYLGYWQIMNAVDKYVVYDNVQYTKKGWFNRNRFLQNGHDELFTINLVKDSDYLDVRDRTISPVFNRKQLVERLKNSYKKAPYFNENFPVVSDIIQCPENNLFQYIYNSINKIHKLFDMKSELIISSSLDIDASLRSANRVKATVLALGGDTYINPIGGTDLYSVDDFKKSGIDLKFHKIDNIEYNQFDNQFIPNLSIIDVMMFNSIDEIKKMMNSYKLIAPQSNLIQR